MAHVIRKYTQHATDTNTFGYQERWAEYRYYPSRISAYFRSTTATPLDAWHLANKFTALPTLADNALYEYWKRWYPNYNGQEDLWHGGR